MFWEIFTNLLSNTFPNNLRNLGTAPNPNAGRFWGADVGRDQQSARRDPEPAQGGRGGFSGTKWEYMGVSTNRGTPKSWISRGFSIISHPFWGNPIFGNTHLENLEVCTGAPGFWNASKKTTIWQEIVATDDLRQVKVGSLEPTSGWRWLVGL